MLFFAKFTLFVVFFYNENGFDGKGIFLFEFKLWKTRWSSTFAILSV